MSDVELLLFLLKRHPELLDLAIGAAQRLGLWPADRVAQSEDDDDEYIWDSDPDLGADACL